MTEARKPQDRTGFAGYHQFRNDEGEHFGSFEIIWLTDDESLHEENSDSVGGQGWYWAACFPGCLPDGVWEGPYRSSRAAYLEAIK